MSKMKVASLVFMSCLVIIGTFLTACSTEEERMKNILSTSWATYKQRFIQEDGRVIDLAADHITTSEGQSYGLLRSLWMNEPELFAKIYQWTNENLKTRQDHLFAWKWGRDLKGNWKVISSSAASDADVDVAFALLMAYEKWGNTTYLQDAQNLLRDIWMFETVELNGQRYLTPGDWAPQKQKVRLNPSYFAPYAYRLFAQYDQEHNWLKLVDSSYDVLEKNIQATETKLVSDWVWLDKDTGNIIIATHKEDGSSAYSYDAIRTYWRLSLDYYLHNDERAKKIIDASQFLAQYWDKHKKMPERVSIRTEVSTYDNSFASYGTYLPAMYYINPNQAETMAQEKFINSFIEGAWGNPDDYYSQNWAWFGLLFYTVQKQAKKIPVTLFGL